MDQWLKLLRGGRRCFSAGVSRSLRCVEEGREAEEDALADAVTARPRGKIHVPLFGKACYAPTENSDFLSLSHTHTDCQTRFFPLLPEPTLYSHINISFTVSLHHISVKYHSGYWVCVQGNAWKFILQRHKTGNSAANESGRENR